MIILVAGGSGFIGRKLVDALVARGDQVTVVTRDPTGATARGRKHVSYRGWLPDLDAYDAVINLSGANLFGRRWNEAYKAELRNSRIDTTRWIVRAITKAADPPKVLINGSAVGYYGDRGTEELPETATAGSDMLAVLCKDWEAEAAACPVRTVMLRTGVVLHPAGGALEQMLPPFKLGAGGPIGSGKPFFPWIHIDDEIGLILWALDNQDVRGPLNAVAPGAVTNKVFTKALGQALRRPTLFPIPPFALRLKMGEVASVLTASIRVVPRVATEHGYVFRYPEIGPALADLLGRN